MINYFFILLALLLSLSSVAQVEQTKAQRKRERRSPPPSAYNDFINFMEEYNFSAGGPLTDINLNCGPRDDRMARPGCSTREIFSQYREHFPEDQPIIFFPDATALPNPYYQAPESEASEENVVYGRGESDQISEILSQATKRTAEEVNTQIEKIRESFIKTITLNSNQGELSDFQIQMINRINTITVTFSDEQCSGAKAAFYPSSLEVSACSNLLALPEHALVPIIAHEMGHSLDFCSGSHRCYSHNQGSGEIISDEKRNELRLRFIADNPSGNAEQLTQSFNSYLDNFIKITNRRGIAEVLDPTFSSEINEFNFSSIQSFYNKLIEDQKLTLTDSGIPQSELPITAVQECLSNNFYLPTLPSDLDILCQGSSNTERGAQTWSAMVTGQYVEDNPPISFHQKLALMATSITNFNGKNTHTWEGKENDFNTLFMSSKQIQEVFNCEPMPTQSCL